MDFLFKRTTSEKLQATSFLLMWTAISLYFGLEGYKNFSHPFLWSGILLFGFIVSLRQWQDSQTSILLKEDSFLWKTFSFSREIAYKEIFRIENNIDRNRIFFYLKNGKKYFIRLGDSDYSDFFAVFIRKNKAILENLEIPKRVYFSYRYLLSVLAIFIIPFFTIAFYIYIDLSFLSFLLGALVFIFILSFLFSILKDIPLYYDFRESYFKGKFLFKKTLYIPYQDLDKVFITSDKKGFWRCSLLGKDSYLSEIQEMPMSLSLYFYFIFLKEKIGFSKNA